MGKGWAMVKPTPEQQSMRVENQPEACRPYGTPSLKVAGSGEHGCARRISGRGGYPLLRKPAAMPLMLK